MIKKEKKNIVATFSYGLIFCGLKCLHARTQNCALLRTISFTGNYRLFAHSDISYTFNGENDNVVLEYGMYSNESVGRPTK